MAKKKKGRGGDGGDGDDCCTVQQNVAEAANQEQSGEEKEKVVSVEEKKEVGGGGSGNGGEGSAAIGGGGSGNGGEGSAAVGGGAGGSGGEGTAAGGGGGGSGNGGEGSAAVGGGAGGSGGEGTAAGGGGGGGGGGKKEQEGPLTVLLKVDMHCEGCTQKIQRSAKGFPGVERVTVDAAANRLTVVGRVDPWELRDRVAAKTRKAVEIVSPANYPRKESAAPMEQKNTEDNKPKVPVVSTEVLKIRLCCLGCVQQIRKILAKIKGVEQVTVDMEKNMIIVKGTMDAELLPVVLKKKMNRHVEVVQPTKDGGGGSGSSGACGGGEKKKGGQCEKIEMEGEGITTAVVVEAASPEANKLDYRGSDGCGSSGGSRGGREKKKGRKGEKKKEDEEKAATPKSNKLDQHGGSAYRFEMVNSTQLFSDENPNGCAIL